MKYGLKGRLGNREFFKELFSISLPIILTNLMTSSLHIIDNIMVGSLGDVALAGVAQANQLAFVLRVTLFGMGGGCAIFASQHWGNQDVQGVQRSLGISMGSALIFCIPATLAAIFAPGFILRLYTPDAAVIAAGAEYLQMVGPSYLAIGISMVFNAANRSTERVRVNMVAAFSAIAINAFLNWCLIFGNLGFPRMGVRGAALATTIAAYAELFIMVGWSYLKKYPTAAKFAALKPPNFIFIKRFYRVAIPVMLNEGLWSLGTSVYYAVYGRMSIQTVAAMNIYNTVDQVMMAAIFGIMNATAVMVGKRIGAGKEEEAVTCGRRMLILSVVLGLFMGVLLFFLRKPILSIFNISEEAKSLCFSVMGIAAAMLWLRSFNSTNMVGVLRSGGDSLYSLVVEGISIWGIGVPIAFVFGLLLHQPLPIVFIAIHAEEAAKSVVGYLRFRSGKWVHNLVRGA